MKTALLAAVMIVLIAIVGVGAYLTGQSNGLTEAQNIRTEFLQSRPSPAAGQGSATLTGSSTRSQASRPLASGTVKSIQGQVIEITQQDGSVVIVAVNDQTVIQKTVTAAVNELQVGQRVTIQGTQATGQVDAAVIQITPAGP